MSPFQSVFQETTCNMSRLLISLIWAATFAPIAAYMSPMCCGDNFCCAVIQGGTVSCWGGLSTTTVIAETGVSSYRSLTDVKYVACAGKTLVAIDMSSQILAVMGKTGYGADSVASSQLGTAITDASVSFWGGAFITTAGAISAWSQGDTFASSSSSQSWYPAADTSGASCDCTTATRSMALTAPSGVFSMVACGGKRAGHFCCAVLASGQSGDAVQCFGDVTGTYTPTASELSAQGLTYRPYQLSAGCDFLCVLTSSGVLGIYEHSSKQLTRYSSTWPSQLSLGSDGLDTSGTSFVQVACGTFAAYAIESTGTLSSWGRVFTDAVGPVLPGTDTTGSAASFTSYLQRQGSQVGLLAANSGFGHACAVSSGNTGDCWGADYSSQVSSGNAVSSIDTSSIYPNLLGNSPTSALTNSPTSAPTNTPASASTNNPTSAPTSSESTGQCENDTCYNSDLWWSTRCRWGYCSGCPECTDIDLVGQKESSWSEDYAELPGTSVQSNSAT